MTPVTNGPTESSSRKQRNLLIACFVLAIAATFTPLATVEIGLVPLASFAGGAYLSRRSRPLFIALVLWLFFLAPMLRRMVDFHTGSTSASAIIASPILACVAATPPLRRLWSLARLANLKWMVLIVATYAYAAFVGFMLHSPVALVQEIVLWTGPLAFALYLFDQREHLPEMYQAFRDQFLFGTLVMGLYGLYQYAVLAPWDATWMENANLTTIGTPEPFGVRVFSTMNAPQTFADFLLLGILLSTSSTRRLRYVAIPAGLMALILTNSRSAWVGAAAGVVFTVVFFPPKRRVQIVAALTGSILFLAIAFQIPQFNEQLSRRFETFHDLKSDSSVNDRMVSQQHAIELFLERPFGTGFGGGSDDSATGPTHGVATVQGVYMNDNGLEQVTLTFGWFGSIVFALGMAGVVFSCFRPPALREMTAINAALLSLLVQIPTMGLFAAAPGFLLWSVMMLITAYQENRRHDHPMPRAIGAGQPQIQQV